MKDEVKSRSERVVAWIAIQDAERRNQQVGATRLCFSVEEFRRAELKELVAQSENQLMHREAQEGRWEHAESTVRRLEQQAKELQGMIKNFVMD